MFRQKSGSRKTQVVAFRLNNLEFEILKIIADKNGISIHELCRRIILAYLKAKGYIM